MLNTFKVNELIVDPRKAHMLRKEVEFCGHIHREEKITRKWETTFDPEMGTTSNHHIAYGIFGIDKLLLMLCPELLDLCSNPNDQTTGG